MILNEDDFETIEVPNIETKVVTDTEIEPEGPKLGVETGIANIIHDLIIDENEAIQQYNNAAINMEDYPELQKIMQDIVSEEFAHIGELQKALELVISPNAANIEEGEVETEDNLAETETPVDESINEDTKKKSNGKWVNKGDDGEHGEFKTKKEADAQRRAMFANHYHEDLDTHKTITCDCGNQVDLWDEYNGTCECQNCGKWYDLDGNLVESPASINEELNISDDNVVLRAIDSAIMTNPVASKLSKQEIEDLANQINVELHLKSEGRRNSRRR